MAVITFNSEERQDIYRRIFLLNRSFHLAVQTLDELKVLLPPRDLKDMRGLTQEVQLEINYLLLDSLHSFEEHDWAQFGKVRIALEKRLIGPEPKPLKKADEPFSRLEPISLYDVRVVKPFPSRTKNGGWLISRPPTRIPTIQLHPCISVCNGRREEYSFLHHPPNYFGETMKRFLVIALLFVCTALGVAQAQNAVVKRNTCLREGPSSSDKKIILLKAGDELELIDPGLTDNYYHVRTLDGDEGYAYSRNVTVKEAPEKISKELAAPSGKPAEEISSDWDKPAPKKIAFHGKGGDCPWNGDDSDPGTFVNKNRADTPEADGITYHDVTWAAIANLKYPVAKPLRKNWTKEQIAEITPFEGEAVRTTGYLVAYSRRVAEVVREPIAT